MTLLHSILVAFAVTGAVYAWLVRRKTARLVAETEAILEDTLRMSREWTELRAERLHAQEKKS